MRDKTQKPLFQRLKENQDILNRIFLMIITQKRWVLLPLFFLLAVLSLFMALVGGTSVLPVIYALF